MPPPLLVHQAGVIPVLDNRLCLVTSRNGRRWVFPKGIIDSGHTPGEAALLEAWEEAGLVGTLDAEPLGSYVYDKDRRPHHVLVYRMRVIEARDVYPERGLRERIWLTVDDAIDRVEEPTLRELLRRVFGVSHPDRITLSIV
jgi:8-oxo-dGTP pyrophosphatase MutT (NUDIX family)